jgi:hypothetical protein
VFQGSNLPGSAIQNRYFEPRSLQVPPPVSHPAWLKAAEEVQ